MKKCRNKTENPFIKGVTYMVNPMWSHFFDFTTNYWKDKPKNHIFKPDVIKSDGSAYVNGQCVASHKERMFCMQTFVDNQ